MNFAFFEYEAPLRGIQPLTEVNGVHSGPHKSRAWVGKKNRLRDSGRALLLRFSFEVQGREKCLILAVGFGEKERVFRCNG